MLPNRLAAALRNTPARRLLGQSSRPAIILAVGALALPAVAQAQSQPFQSMIAMQAGQMTLPDGTVSVWSGAERPMIGTAADGRPLMTIHQTRQKALLDWEQFRLQTNEILEFQQQSSDWIAVNRVHGAQAAQIDGELRGKGRIFIFNDNGVLLGKDAKVNVRQLVTGSGVKDVNVDGATTTLIQSGSKAIVNWSDMSSQAGEVLRISQQQRDWVMLNRSLAPGTTVIGGNIEADGQIVLSAPQGLAINGKVKAQQVIAAALGIRDDQFTERNGLLSYPRFDNSRYDPTFSNTWFYGSTFDGDLVNDLLTPPPPVSDPNDPLRYKMTIGASGAIETGSYGKIMLFGPTVINRGLLTVKDEGQVILGAGDNIYLTGDGKNVTAYVGAFNPIASGRVNLPYLGLGSVFNEDRQRFWQEAFGETYAIGDTVPNAGARVEAYLNKLQVDRIAAIGFHARNEGIIRALRGGSISFRGHNLEQMGGIEMTSTALFRGAIDFRTQVYDYREYANNDQDGPSTGNGNVVFGKGSLTQITPDLDSTDAIPLNSGPQSVGTLTAIAAHLHMQEDSMIYMPSGSISVLLDAHVGSLGGNRGAGSNQDNESGVRFMMESGATIDLSGWKSTILPMGYHQVTGRLFAAQLADSPLQRDGALYRKEITIDRRYGTNVADWASFDNLSQGTLAQFLLNGGKFSMDLDDDFIMKSGSVIDVSGGKITYEKGFVYTTLLRTLDNRIIDIREASPDQLYMGLANEWTRYDTKWGKQKTYYIPFMSSTVGRYEDGYEQGGAGGLIEILAPDVVLQGTLKGNVTVGKYQRDNLPKGGAFVLNDAGESEGEYIPNNMLISRIEQLLPKDFGLKASLADVYGDFFGEEYDGSVPIGQNGQRSDNAMLVAQDFFNRSTMGSYFVRQDSRSESFNPFPPRDGLAVRVEAGVNLNLQNGASFELSGGDRVEFLGSVRTEGGDVSIGGLSLVFGKDSRIDTRGSWYNDLADTGDAAGIAVPRIDGGSVTIGASNAGKDIYDDVSLVLPETMVIDTSGGGWIDRGGTIHGGKGGAISVEARIQPEDTLDLGALSHARAYGLAGNGAYSLSTLAPIVIADSLPEDADPGAMLIAPSFFEGSGFSAIKLGAPSVTIPENVQVKATAGALVLRVPTLTGGVSYLDFASGSDIYDVAEIRVVPLEQRPAALRQGMKIELPGLFMGEGSLLSTEARGTIATNGADIAGTILAPAGVISLSNGVLLRGTAKLLAPGAVLVTNRDIGADGRQLTDGVVLPGGKISLSSLDGLVSIEKGAVLDVSGASATFDVPGPMGEDGVTVRMPTLVASDGGSIEISSQEMSINDATYLAHAGGATARGGALSIDWNAIYKNPVEGGGSPGDMVDQLESYFTYGYFYDLDGNLLTTLYGTDLSRVNWSNFGLSLNFPAGYRIASRNALVSQFDQLTVAAAGVPPMFVIGDAAKIDLPSIEAPTIDTPVLELFAGIFGYAPPVITPSEPKLTGFSPEKIGAGGFSSVSISASPGIVFTDGVTLGGRRSDGGYVLDHLSINSPRLIGTKGANVKLEANIVRLGASSGDGQTDQALYDAALGSIIDPKNAGTTITLQARTLIDVDGANFYGWSQSNLFSGGDIRLRNGGILSPGELVFKADQLYAATARDVSIVSGERIRILAQDDGGPLNGTPYEAAAKLTFRAPLIEQGGIVRSPLGAISFEGVGGEGTVKLLPGSITSVNADGHVIPYGRLSNGDTWVDPLIADRIAELRALPEKAISITAANVDLQTGATLDVAGSGDLYAREFIPGLGGSNDWLTGYRDANYDWVSAPGEIFAVIPDFQGDIAPIGLGNGGNIPVGSKIYLSGGSGLKAGYYTLLPAEYAILPGAYRVTSKHHYAGNFSDMPLGEIAHNPDGSTIQAGYRFTAGQTVRDQRNSGFLVMSGDTLRTRSEYAEAFASTFFTSEAFLKKALRTNQPIGEVPRIPIDGGSVVLTAGKQLNLNATLKSAAAKGGRGGFADINAPKLAVVGANTDRSQYDGYLLLDSDALNRFGAESLLLGGVRRQGAVNLELTVGATDIVVDNAGSVLAGPELLLAAANGVSIRKGAALETRGQISGSSGDLRVLPGSAAFTDDRGTPFDPSDDIVHPAYDQGTLLRLSSSEQVDVLRNLGAVDALQALFADPQRLAIVNASRIRYGLAPLTPGGMLTIADGARISSSRSLAMDTTGDISLAGGATLASRQISAAASRVSIGEVPAGTDGLVFSGGSLGALAAAEDIALRSYSSIDFYGTATLRAENGLTLDTREIRAVGDASDLVTVAAKTLTIANANGGEVSTSAGTVGMVLTGENVRITGGDKAISGVKSLTIEASQRVIGSDDGTLFTPGALTVKAGGITADSGSRLFFDAGGAISLASGTGELKPFATFGATIGFAGSSIESAGRIALTGGIVNLHARNGDVVLANGSSIDVTSSVSRIFDVDIGVGAGTVNLISDRGNISLAPDAVIDVSGSSAGGDAGRFTASAGLGQVTLGAGIKGTAAAGYRAGSFGMQAATLGDFGALNAALDSGGFFDTRRFEFNQGDATITGTIRVRDFSMVANDGSISLAGTIQTLGDNGGRVQLAAAESVNLLGTGQIIAKANAASGSGGTVLLETVGRNGGRLNLAAGSTIDVSGTGEGGRLVRLRAPQIGTDVAIGQVGGTITGARQVLAEAFRVYDDVSVIDQPVIDMVEGDAAQFMTNAPAIQARLGAGITVVPGIELRSEGDMELKTDWDLHDVRFGGAAGVLTLRAQGDLKINGNLSDGFSMPTAAGTLQNGPSWTFNLTSGANITSPNSLAVLPAGLLASGKGSIVIGGTPDTIEYFFDPAHGNENRLYRKNPLTGRFIREGEEVTWGNPHVGWVELERDGQGRYIDPTTRLPIAKDPATGDYADTLYYARRPLPTLYFDDGGGYERMRNDGQIVLADFNLAPIVARDYLQWDNSTGYLVRTGTAGINVASAQDLVLQYRPSVIYTAGENAPPVAGFYAPPAAAYPINGGDLSISVAGTITGSGSPQLPTGWLGRRSRLRTDGIFAPGQDREFEQSTWYVDFSRYQAGVGALGGGNVDISAGGDIINLSVNLPTTGRLSGNTQPNEATALTVTGGGDLTIRAGGNIGSGKFYVADGLGLISAGGGFITTDSVRGSRPDAGDGRGPDGIIYYYIDPLLKLQDHDVYTMLYTSSGEFRVQSGGDMDIEAVLDPLMPATDRDESAGFLSYTPDARVSLFSAGGDITLWNNGNNIDLLRVFGDVLNPTGVNGVTTRPYGGNSYISYELWPANVSVVAAAGDINVLGGLLMAPSAKGTLDLLARGDVHIGNATRIADQFVTDPDAVPNANFRSALSGITLSQSYVELIQTPSAPKYGASYQLFNREMFYNAGSGQLFDREYAPVLHVGDTQPVRIYAGDDIISSAAVNLPKAGWFQAGGDVYFPNLTFQHNNLQDFSLVRAGAGLYFNASSYITVNGPGRLEIETGGDLWIPSNANGITSNWLTLPDPNPYDTRPAEVLNPGQKAADIGVSVGFNQRPDVEAFEASYLDPNGSTISYLLKDAGDGKQLSYYLFDRLYTRGDIAPDSVFFSTDLRAGFVNYIRERQGLLPLETPALQAEYLETAWDFWRELPAGDETPFDQFFPGRARAGQIGGEFYLPNERQGLVNYVRQLQGLEALQTQEEQLAYLDTAWTYWEGLTEDYKSPFLRDVMYLELRTTGREANAPANDRFNTTFRGYDAIKTLFPGAEKRVTEALAEGESRWKGDFETYASRVLSNGGGKIDAMVPGGGLKLANIAATPDDTGQPPSFGGRGNALRAGLVTANGGAINIFTHDSVTVNQSRILTALGGDMLIWSSYGDIAAGKGAKTSISPTFYNYTLDQNVLMNRTPAGLPTGAGIGTVASIPGAPVADVDLVAPNGIVDAGDAGIRVSGNFNVFAVQILGTDNIDVSGISTGLPAPPATPLGIIQPTETDAQSRAIANNVMDQVKQASRNKGLASPSIIEVRVTGFGEACANCDDRAPTGGGMARAPQGGETAMAETPAPTRVAENRHRFDIAEPTLNDAVVAVGRMSRANIVYDRDELAGLQARPVRGSMTTEQALTSLVRGSAVNVRKIGENSYLLKGRGKRR